MQYEKLQRYCITKKSNHLPLNNKKYIFTLLPIQDI